MTQPNIKVPCEVYSRIVGYLRPISDWNVGKRQEFSERHTYDADMGGVLPVDESDDYDYTEGVNGA